MTVFLVASGVLLATVLALLLLPLLRGRTSPAAGTEAQLSLHVLREQLAELEQERNAGRVAAADFERERQELERRALEEGAGGTGIDAGSRRPRMAIAVALIVPLLAAGLYWQLGRFDALSGKPAAVQGGNHALNPQQIQAMAQKLAERLQQNPQDVEGWVMLARSYSVLRRFPESAAAFGRAVSLRPNDANLLADYADTLAMAQGRRLAGEPEQLIARALAADPRHIKALALKGSAAFERQSFQEAIGEWEKVLALVPAESGVAQGMRNSIADARARFGGAAQPAATPQPAPAAAAGAGISGVVSIDPAFQPEPGASLFIFARAVNGPRMPLAMQRRSADQLPLRFRLDDSMAMAPGVKLSDHRQVIVGARISRSGDALAKTGDIEGYSDPVNLGSDNVRVVIAKPVP